MLQKSQKNTLDGVKTLIDGIFTISTGDRRILSINSMVENSRPNSCRPQGEISSPQCHLVLLLE